MSRIDIIDLWGWGLLVVALAVVGTAIFLITLAITAPHTVQQYYIGHPGSTSQRGVCVMASINWETDDTVYCTDDVNKAVEELGKLNAAIGLVVIKVKEPFSQNLGTIGPKNNGGGSK